MVQSTYLLQQDVTLGEDMGHGVIAARDFNEGDAIMIYKGELLR